MKTTSKPRIKVRTGLKAGRLAQNHNQRLRSATR